MSIVPQNFQSYLSTLRIIFIALLIGQVMALGIFYFIHLQHVATPPPPERRKVLLQILTLFLASLLAISFFLHRRKLAEARAKSSLKEKFTTYRTALILRWAPMEVATFLAGAFYLVTGLPFMFYLAGLLLVLFGMQWPNRLDVINNLHLSSAEQLTLDDPNVVVSEISRRP